MRPVRFCIQHSARSRRKHRRRSIDRCRPGRGAARRQAATRKARVKPAGNLWNMSGNPVVLLYDISADRPSGTGQAGTSEKPRGAACSAPLAAAEISPRVELPASSETRRKGDTPQLRQVHEPNGRCAGFGFAARQPRKHRAGSETSALLHGCTPRRHRQRSGVLCLAVTDSRMNAVRVLSTCVNGSAPARDARRRHEADDADV